jgi:hypothetical protein
MKKHNVSETGSVSVLRWGKTPTLLGPLERANLNHWTVINLTVCECLTPATNTTAQSLTLPAETHTPSARRNQARQISPSINEPWGAYWAWLWILNGADKGMEVFLHLVCLSIQSLVQSTFSRRTFRQLLWNLFNASNLKPSTVCKYLIIWRVVHASIIRHLASDQRKLILELPKQPTPWYRMFLQLSSWI